MPITLRKKRLKSCSESIVAWVDQVISILIQRNWSERNIHGVNLALSEALTNAHKHGNKSDPAKVIDVFFKINRSTVTLTVQDEGSGFDPALLPDPTSPDRIEVPHGRGVFLMQSYMHQGTVDGNKVTMIKQRAP